MALGKYPSLIEAKKPVVWHASLNKWAYYVSSNLAPVCTLKARDSHSGHLQKNPPTPYYSSV